MTTYTIYFTPVNALPKTGSIQVGYPRQVSIASKFRCAVRSNRLITDQNICSVNVDSRTITITGAFAEINGNWANQVSIELQGIKNPITNKEGEGFVIQTYEDSQQLYAMDTLKALNMQPIMDCPAPFMRMKTAINHKEYTQLCHIILELETYMLEIKSLPTDFDSVAPALKAALDPTMVFRASHHIPEPTVYEHEFEQAEFEHHTASVDASIEDLMSGYDITGRIDELELR